MAVEIERKFLVDTDQWRRLSSAKKEKLRQGYLTGNGPACNVEVKIRRADQKAFITVKGKGGVTRQEFEYEIPTSDADRILDQLCVPRVIEKTRYHIEYGGKVWHIDEYSGSHKGQVTAEVELEHEEQSIDLPSWLGKEVTDNPKYRNANLAANPETWRQT